RTGNAEPSECPTSCCCSWRLETGPTVFAVCGRPSLTKPSESALTHCGAPAPQFLSERAAAPCAGRRRPSLHISLAIPTCRVSPATESSLAPDEVGKVFHIGGRDGLGQDTYGYLWAPLNDLPPGLSQSSHRPVASRHADRGGRTSSLSRTTCRTRATCTPPS